LRRPEDVAKMRGKQISEVLPLSLVAAADASATIAAVPVEEATPDEAAAPEAAVAVEEPALPPEPSAEAETVDQEPPVEAEAPVVEKPKASRLRRRKKADS